MVYSWAVGTILKYSVDEKFDGEFKVKMINIY